MANPENDTQQNTAGTGAATTANQASLGPEVSDVLARLYWERRLEYQLQYYQERAADYEQNVDMAFRLGAILMTLSSLLASLGVVVTNDIWSPLISLLTAIIPAIVSYIAAFRQLYQWDRQLALYRDTQINLESAKLAIDDLDSLTPELAQQSFPGLVTAVEDVLRQEIAQWGQIARGQTEDDDEAATDLEDQLRQTLTDANGYFDEARFNEMMKIYNASDGTPTAGEYRLAPDELETNSALLDQSFYDRQDQQRRERNAAIAMAASQTIQDIDTQPEPVAPALTTSDFPAVVDTPEQDVATDDFMADVSPVIEQSPAPPVVDEPVSIEQPETLSDEVAPEVIDPVIDTTADAEVEELPTIPADRQTSFEPDTIEDVPTTVNINPESVSIADNVAIGTESSDSDNIVFDDSEPVEEAVIANVPSQFNVPAEPLLPNEGELADQIPEINNETSIPIDNSPTIEDLSYNIDDVIETSADDLYDDDDGTDVYDIEEIDDY